MKEGEQDPKPARARGSRARGTERTEERGSEGRPTPPRKKGAKAADVRAGGRPEATFVDPEPAKLVRIQAILDELYEETPVPLDHTDAFTLLIAVLLSAQTTDARVNLVTPGLFAKAGDPFAMAALSVEDILASIKTCGLAPTKAKNIKRLSEILVAEHNGVVPSDMAALEALPGVGHKTASVVVAQAFGTPAFPVDTHIFRLAHRWGLSVGKTVEKVEADLKRHFPEEAWNRLHLQIIFFGREHCPAKRHDPAGCPICSWAAPSE